MKVVLSGCSGGGKSSLLAELARRGVATVPEPGRRIVDDPDAAADLPWVDISRFMARCFKLAAADYAASGASLVVFDRSLLDVATAYARQGELPVDVAKAVQDLRYDPTVYLVPPWPEIYMQDESRRHDFAAASAEYDALRAWLPRWGYATIDMPRLTVEARAKWLMARLRPLRPGGPSHSSSSGSGSSA